MSLKRRFQAAYSDNIQSDRLRGEQIGSGRNGRVYAGLGGTAIKQVKFSLLTWIREIAIVKYLSPFPYIINYHPTLVITDHVRCVELTMSRGVTLDTINRVVVTTMLRHITMALVHCHSNGIIHRDVKPRNILHFDGSPPDERFVLCDFGDALITRYTHRTIGPGALTGEVTTIPFRAPEVFAYHNSITYEEAGRVKPYDAAMDMWSFGMTLICVLCHNKTLFDTMGIEEFVALAGNEEKFIASHIAFFKENHQIKVKSDTPSDTTVMVRFMEHIIRRMIAPTASRISAADLLALITRYTPSASQWENNMMHTLLAKARPVTESVVRLSYDRRAVERKESIATIDQILSTQHPGELDLSKFEHKLHWVYRVTHIADKSLRKVHAATALQMFTVSKLRAEDFNNAIVASYIIIDSILCRDQQIRISHITDAIRRKPHVYGPVADPDWLPIILFLLMQRLNFNPIRHFELLLCDSPTWPWAGEKTTK